jgi:hypothetical protein
MGSRKILTRRKKIMARSTKSQLPPPAPRPATPNSATQRIVQGNPAGSAPRVLPPVDGFTRAQINQGRALAGKAAAKKGGF